MRQLAPRTELLLSGAALTATTSRANPDLSSGCLGALSLDPVYRLRSACARLVGASFAPKRRTLVTLSRGAAVRKKQSRDQYTTVQRRLRVLLAFEPVAGSARYVWPTSSLKGALRTLNVQLDHVTPLETSLYAAYRMRLGCSVSLTFVALLT